MATLDSIVRYGINNRVKAASKYPAGHWVRKAEEMQTLLQQKAQDWRQRLAVITADTGLTDEGKLRAKQKLAGEVREEVKPVDTRVLTALVKERDALALKLNGPAVTLSDVERDEARETRELFRVLDESKRSRLFEEALTNGDDFTVRAILAAPRAFPLIPARIADAAKKLLTERANPALAAELADYDMAEKSLRENYNDVVRDVTQEAGLVQDDLRARLYPTQSNNAA